MDNRLPQIRTSRRDTLEKHFLFCSFIPQGKLNYKIINIEYFIEQLHVEKKYRM